MTEPSDVRHEHSLLLIAAVYTTHVMVTVMVALPSRGVVAIKKPCKVFDAMKNTCCGGREVPFTPVKCCKK
jgi:hypothetical protein